MVDGKGFGQFCRFNTMNIELDKQEVEAIIQVLGGACWHMEVRPGKRGLCMLECGLSDGSAGTGFVGNELLGDDGWNQKPK